MMECGGDYDVIVVGAGPGGIAAAISAYENGAEKVLLVDRNAYIGGILKQCIHDGFGLIRFNESLTGPEYACRYAALLDETNVDILLDTMVTKLSPDKAVICVKKDGLFTYRSKAVVLATGCRERTRGMLGIPGSRPSGIYTAGVAQYMVNVQNLKPGSRIVILGSGDVGLIMARRLHWEGMEVLCVLEKLPYCAGLARNKYQCLDDWGIPLHLNRTVVNIKGTKRLEKIIAADVDDNENAIAGTEYDIECDTLILSVGLIPENEVAKTCGIILNERNAPVVDGLLQTSVRGIFACGNSLQVLDLVDKVSSQGEIAGRNAAEYAKNVQREQSVGIEGGIL